MVQRLLINPHTATFDDLAPAARVLLDGGVIAGPTGTFYALISLVDNATALERVMVLKGAEERQKKPFLILIDQIPRARCYAREVPEEARGLMEAFWPGPLTLLFLGFKDLHPSVVGPAKTVGLRVDDLLATRLLVRMLDRGLTGTSANPAGAPPASTADEVAEYFGDSIDLLLDGGPTSALLPSTIIDVSLGAPRLIRDGGLPLAQLTGACPILRI